QNIQAGLDLQNPSGYNNVYIHDEGDLSARSVNVFANPIDGSPYEEVLVGVTQIYCKVADTRSVFVNTSSAGSTANVFGTASFFGGVETIITQQGSSNVVNVGSGADGPGTLATINGPLTVANGLGYSNLNLHDELDGVSRTGTISGTAITGLSNGPIHTGASIGNLTVNGGTGNNTYNITGSPAQFSVTLNTGAGADTTNLQANGVPTTITTTTGDGGGGNNVVNLGT